MNKWAGFLSLLFIIVFFSSPTFCQNQILGKMKVKGPEENLSVIGEPKQVLLRVKSAIRDLKFESSMSKELPVHKQGESTYNVYVPPGKQYVTIMAEGFQNVEIFYDFKENRSYLIELEPEEIPIPFKSETLNEVETESVKSPTVPPVSNKWAKHRNIGLAGALATGITAGLFRVSANKSYDSYKSATTADEVKKFRDETEQKDLYTIIFAGVSGAFLTYAVFSWINQGSSSLKEHNLSVGFTGNTFAVSINF